MTMYGIDETHTIGVKSRNESQRQSIEQITIKTDYCIYCQDVVGALKEDIVESL